MIVDPISDPRWLDLVNRHPSASIFHTPGWLSALRQTYGYEPLAVTTSIGSTLANGIVTCRINGWWSRRLVSLPFSDHCDPLVGSSDEVSGLLTAVDEAARTMGVRAVELRPRHADEGFARAAGARHLVPAGSYAFHRLDLRRELPEIFRRMHPSSTQRAIRRAEREGLTYECGTSEEHLAAFYRLLRMTRRRHGLPPQPLAWFRNLMAALGDRLGIHVVRTGGRSIASILTLTFRNTVVYKYGGSDAAHHSRGAMPFLFWRVVQQARAAGADELDLGRSDADQAGLIAFKDHFGAERSTMTYFRSPDAAFVPGRGAAVAAIARRLVSHLPDGALDLAGRVLYRHVG